MSYKIGSYTIQTQDIFNILNKAEIKSDEELKELDKNGDKTISEDEFIDISQLAMEDSDEENSSTTSTSMDEKLEKQILNLYKQLDNLDDTRRMIQSQMGTAQDLEESQSLQSQLESCNTEIQNVRGQIYKAYYNAEVQAANAQNAMNGNMGATAITGADGGTYTYSGNNQQFVNSFNNSSFKQGVLNGKGEMVAAIAEKYGLDPNLLASIMALETGWGTSSAIKNYNNPGGMMDPSSNWMSLTHYSSLEAGIEAVAKNLKNNYINQGLTTISSIGAKYCPVGAANDPNGTNSGWVPSVTKIYNMLTGANISATTRIG